MSKPSAWRTPAAADDERRNRQVAATERTLVSLARLNATFHEGKLTNWESPVAKQEDNALFMIDIGANLAHKRFAHDIQAVIERSIEANVRKVVVTGTSMGSSFKAVELACRYPGILYTTVGVHPHDAKNFDAKTVDSMRRLIQKESSCVRAIGECGLDFDRNFSTPEDQITAFRSQLELACELMLPLFLHERSAHAKFLQVMKEFHPNLPPAVVHCFTGTEAELRAYLELDLHIGITGWICDERRGRDLRKIVNLIPWDRLMIETDAPFLTPRDLRPAPKDNRNEPCYLLSVAQAIALARKCTVEEVILHTTRTARIFFKL